jgi:hypothetical protein
VLAAGITQARTHWLIPASAEVVALAAVEEVVLVEVVAAREEVVPWAVAATAKAARVKTTLENILVSVSGIVKGGW